VLNRKGSGSETELTRTQATMMNVAHQTQLPKHCLPDLSFRIVWDYITQEK